MALKIKQKVVKNFYDAIHNKFYLGSSDELFGCFKVVKNKENKILWNIRLPLPSDAEPDSQFFRNSQSELLKNEILKSVKYTTLDKNLQVEVEAKHFIKDVLDSNPVSLNFKPLPKKIIMEFSSPNIAKPFHVGHLRSTMIGNSLANIKQKLGHDVIKMNYLGDWGTQFGVIQIGLELEKYSDEVLAKNPIELLFKAYVRGNKETQRHEELYNKAKQVFADLESGNEEIIQLWNKYRNWTQVEFDGIYGRLGVSFDEYCWESTYKRKEADGILKQLEEKGILSVDEKNRKIATIGELVLPLVKSDDTTLYLLRDLMALTDRRQRHKFDEMYYVVDNGQSDHFNSLFILSEQLKLNEGVKLEHLKFGRIHGMSTRKGKVVFLSDILDEARERTFEKQVNSKTTKVELHSKDIADILGVSAVVVNDLKQHRKKDYKFVWEDVVQLNGTGVHLQYCHCRLCSLEENSGVKAAAECDPEALLEPEAINLILETARFEEVLLEADKKLETCILVKYLFDLAKAVNLAMKTLNVKNTEHVGSQRLLMFNKSREVLAEGLKLLGLRLLTKM